MADDGLVTAGLLVTASTSILGPTIDGLNSPGSARWGYVGRIFNWSDSVATPGISYFFRAQQSTDGTAWTNLFETDVITPGTAVSYHNVALALPIILTKRYFRFNLVMSNTTGTPLVVFQVGLDTEFPG